MKGKRKASMGISTIVLLGGILGYYGFEAVLNNSYHTALFVTFL